MGFFGKLWKGVKNIFSGIGNFVKSAVSGKNWWKTALVGATAYFGGAALGYWNSPVVSSINGAWAGDMSSDGSRKGGWFGEMFGAKSGDFSDQVYSKHLKDTDQYDAENYKDSAGNYDDLPPVPMGGTPKDLPPTPTASPRVNNVTPAPKATPESLTTTTNPLTKGAGLLGGAVDSVMDGAEYAGAKTTGMLGAVWDDLGKHDRLAAVGLSALGGAFEDKQQDAYETAQGTLQAKQDMNKIGGVPKGSRFGAKATASARQTKPSSEAEMEKLRQSMTPQQWAEYVQQMELEGQKTPSRVV